MKGFYLDADGSSGDSDTELAMAYFFYLAFELFKRKHKAYGPTNIARLGFNGVLSRLIYDKGARLERVLNGQDLPDESVEDALYDTAVYAIIALVLKHGFWPQLVLKTNPLPEELCSPSTFTQTNPQQNLPICYSISSGASSRWTVKTQS